MKSQKYKATAIILAGGLSKRMGYSKELIKVDNEYLIYKTINQLNELFNEVIVVSNNVTFYKDSPCKVVQDIIPKKSPLVGLHAGLTYSSNEYNYLIACDMPNISIDYINYCYSLLNNEDAYVPKIGKYYEPFQGFYNRNIVQKLESFISKNLKFQDFINSIKHVVIKTNEFMTVELFKNINTEQDLNSLDFESGTIEELTIHKYNDFNDKEVNDYIITEYPITLFINNEKYVTMLITPTQIKELILGYMKSEKLIESIDDVKSVNINMTENRADVTTHNDINHDNYSKDKLLASGCGVGTRFHDDIDNIVLESVLSSYHISYDEIINASKELNNASGLFKLTGGVHSCLLFTKGDQYYFEDIGRHNAVDKAVGYVLINKLNTNSSYIISSGRISSDMLIKCAISKIPVVISRSAPTSLAVKLADKMGITLIGFVRGNKFNVYSNKERVIR
ncbi:formate dehydrogenase accessory sulfurtransferase FdhD [Candidatus Izimaplasma bacterium]|nr:formate dehydrogenase accessory sulfurtransferase FdhD [Candidatus Izimaplasma bacterium]